MRICCIWRGPWCRPARRRGWRVRSNSWREPRHAWGWVTRGSMSLLVESACPSCRTRDADDGGRDLVRDDRLPSTRAARVIAVVAVAVLVVVDWVPSPRLRRVGWGGRSHVVQSGLQAAFPRRNVGGVLRAVPCKQLIPSDLGRVTYELVLFRVRHV